MARERVPWQVRYADPKRVEALARAINVPAIIARLMVARGLVDATCAQRYLDPRLADLSIPSGMADLALAVDRLATALARAEQIGVFGDYDVDGVTSAAIVGDYLRRAGGHVILRVARRDEGYGFGTSQAAELVSAGCRVVVLTDCGTADHEAVALAGANGVDVIAIDHHRLASEDWPGFALVNPHRQDCRFPYKGLCSAGLAFYAMAALRRALEADGRAAVDPRENLDLVALGTLADVAPLDGENRILVARGLRALARTTRPGLRELLRIAELEGRAVSSEDVLWRLAPRLNAPGRLGDAQIALDCLSARDGALAVERARECDRLNARRREIQNQVLEQARAQLERRGPRPFCLVAGEGWHAGVVGIVAARLADDYERPAAVVALEGDYGRGSARSVDGIDLFAVLQECQGHFERFGGHAAAAGFTVRRDRIEALGEALDLATGARLAQLRPAPLTIDGVVGLETVNLDLCHALLRLGPHGERNPEPVLAAPAVRVEAARLVGADHVALTLSQAGGQCRAIGFGMAALRPDVGAALDVAFVPQVDDYQGQHPRLRLVGLAAAGEGLRDDGGFANGSG